MPTCVPISDLKNTTAFAETVANADEPVIVTKNGHEVFVCLDAEKFREYRLVPKEDYEAELAREQALEERVVTQVLASIREADQGILIEDETVQQMTRERYGF